jgi:hypothetical protein
LHILAPSMWNLSPVERNNYITCSDDKKVQHNFPCDRLWRSKRGTGTWNYVVPLQVFLKGTISENKFCLSFVHIKLSLLSP